MIIRDCDERGQEDGDDDGDKEPKCISDTLNNRSAAQSEKEENGETAEGDEVCYGNNDEVDELWEDKTNER